MCRHWLNSGFETKSAWTKSTQSGIQVNGHQWSSMVKITSMYAFWEPSGSVGSHLLTTQAADLDICLVSLPKRTWSMSFSQESCRCQDSFDLDSIRRVPSQERLCWELRRNLKGFEDATAMNSKDMTASAPLDKGFLKTYISLLKTEDEWKR